MADNRPGAAHEPIDGAEDVVAESEEQQPRPEQEREMRAQRRRACPLEQRGPKSFDSGSTLSGNVMPAKTMNTPRTKYTIALASLNRRTTAANAMARP